MRRLLAGIGVAIVGTTMMSHAQSPQIIPLSDNEMADRWFVELSSPPAIEGTSSAVLDREEADFHAAARGGGVRHAESRRFKDLWNGVIVSATGRDIAKLRSIPGVQAVHPVLKVSLGPQEDQPGNDIDLITALKQTGADIAQSELGLSGRGVRVAVIDTGIDYDHPDLGGCFGRHCRVEKGFDLVGTNSMPTTRCRSSSRIRTIVRATARTSPASSARTAASRASRPA
jgi:subtilisin family serine protease